MPVDLKRIQLDEMSSNVKADTKSTPCIVNAI